VCQSSHRTAPLIELHTPKRNVSEHQVGKPLDMLRIGIAQNVA
jgi:hypothetical protein